MILDKILSFLLCFLRFFNDFFGYQINVFVTFCGIFGVFFTVVGPILHERCLENCVRSVFRGGLPERSGEPLHVASLHRNLRVSFLCAWCVVRQRLFKLRVRTQRLPEFDMPWMSSFQ